MITFTNANMMITMSRMFDVRAGSIVSNHTNPHIPTTINKTTTPITTGNSFRKVLGFCNVTLVMSATDINYKRECEGRVGVGPRVSTPDPMQLQFQYNPTTR